MKTGTGFQATGQNVTYWLLTILNSKTMLRYKKKR